MSPLRPRLRDFASWWLDHDDGTVELVVLRRVPHHQGTWEKLCYRADDEAGAEALYIEDCGRRYDLATKQAARRQKWGPLEVARPS